MEKTIRITKSQLTYISDDSCKILGNRPTAIPNAFAVILYNPRLDLEQVKRSIEIILEDIKHRIEVNKALEIKETT